MRAFHSLHTKILLGYCVVGSIFIALVSNALIQFRSLEKELGTEQQVVAFYDAVRNARRLEKNFLLYLKLTDLREALEQTDTALYILDDIRTGGRFAVDSSIVKSVGQYRDLLAVLLTTSLKESASQDLLDSTYAAGFAVLQYGKSLDEAASERVGTRLSQHESNLLRTIWAALALALGAGVLVTRSVVRPLRDIELSLQQVAKGERVRVDDQDAGREVESLTRSINATIQKIEIRQESQARSSRLMALGTMLSGVAHELNNPLSNISSSCQILQEEWSDLPAQNVQALLVQIDHQVLRAQRIVSDLLDFSGGRSLKLNNENIRSLIEEALQLVGYQIRGTVRANIDINGDMQINVDRMRFQQVLVNLIKNATEAIQSDGTIYIRARRDTFPAGLGTTLEIEDDGHGIPPECLKRVFDPFFTTKAVGKGVGLGLSVAYEIVTQHGGVLAVDSRVGGGSRFWMHIPDSFDRVESHD